MPISIGSNIASLSAQRRLSQSTGSLESVFERLSSGQRINRASDDAAGLAISSSLRTDARVFNQGLRNINDGVSLLNIADGTVSQLSEIVTRLQELAEQSANGTFSDDQRVSLDTEAQQLRQEFVRITKTAAFNGINLFSGEIQKLRIQAGVGLDGSLASGLGGVMGTGTFGSAISTSSTATMVRAVQSADFNGDGILDIVKSGNGGILEIALGVGDGTFTESQEFTGVGNGRALEVGDFNNDGQIDIASFSDNGASGRLITFLGNGDGTFEIADDQEVDNSNATNDLTLGDFNGDGIIDFATAGAGLGSEIKILSGLGDGTFSLTQTISSSATVTSLQAADLNGDGLDDLIIGGTVTGIPSTGSIGVYLNDGGNLSDSLKHPSNSFNGISEISIGDFNGDGIQDLIAIGSNGASHSVNTFLGTGDGSFTAVGSYAFTGTTNRVATGDTNGDGILDFVVATSTGYSSFLGAGDGTFSLEEELTSTSSARGIELADVDGDGVLDIIGAGDSAAADTTVRFGDTQDGLAPILDFSLASKSGALQAIPMLSRKLDSLSSQRGVIGSFQSRLQSATHTLAATRENYIAAASRIQDADIADESSKLVRLRILQQGATAVLSQANIQPQIALQLLRGI